jgi:hypothetical protein
MSVGRRAHCLAFSGILEDSSREGRRKKVAHPYEVVSGERQQSRELDLVAAAELRSAQQADVLAPPEDFLDQLACSQAQRIPGMPRRAFIYRRATAPIDVLRNVWRRVEFADPGDEVACVVGFVGSHCAAHRTGQSLKHLESSATLRRAVRLSHACIDHQPVTILADGVAEITQLGGRAFALSIELRLGVCRRGVRVVRALFPMKVASRALRPALLGGSSEPSLGRKLL